MMIIVGLKLTHDGSVAVIDDGQLVCSIEAEKLRGAPRYAALHDTAEVASILESEGYELGDVDRWTIDGWHAETPGTAASIPIRSSGRLTHLDVAPYVIAGGTDPAHAHQFSGLTFGESTCSYSSYSHATGHIFSAYATSPFAERGEPAHVLVWDGGMLPHLFRVSLRPLKIHAMGALFPIVGNAFSDFSSHFGPFRESTRSTSPARVLQRTLEVAGKAMAYAALGDETAVGASVFTQLLDELGTISIHTSTELAIRVRDLRDRGVYECTDADAVASFQRYLGALAVSSLQQSVGNDPPTNLCLAGGCALNIKWNSAIRESGVAADVWIPPFPNDSGSALGVAAAEWSTVAGGSSVDWSVFSGPQLVDDTSGARAVACSPEDLGRWLHDTGDPVVVLSGRAEMGPRALGHRSILAAPVGGAMKDRLNRLKGRENFRPVAPIAHESAAREVFDPGRPDPYMLFEHTVRPAWRERVPAVMHLDQSARLQTISHSADDDISRILTAYAEASGVPVLCNTSANDRGRGFFPSVAAALQSGLDLPVWSNGYLYTADTA